ncbi:MAG: acyltransferase [Clostridiales bacterium]|nr:acyltransferase [Clostridiales bacterium]
MQTTRRAERQSNIELLRIIAMLMIIICHFSTHGGFQFPSGELSVNRLWTQCLTFGGNLGVDIFVLISGYFLISSARFKTDKALKLALQIFTYSVLFLAVFTLAGANPYGIRTVITCLFPITYSGWWFASTYFILYLISPYLNKLLRGLDKQDYQKMLALLTVCWCIIPTFSGSAYGSSYLLWFAYLYAVSAYIRLHVEKIAIGPRAAFLGAFAAMLTAFLAFVISDLFESRIPSIGNLAAYVIHMQRLPTVLTALFLFLGFLQIDIGCNRAVNQISSATFGVYLIHENNFVRPFLWGTLFQNASFADSPFLIPYSLAATLIVFVCCTLIELSRMAVLEKHYMGLVKKVSLYIDSRIERLFASELSHKSS